jgi:DNA-binding FrmR family transcriptional regulator
MIYYPLVCHMSRMTKGQIEGLERAVSQGGDCYRVLQQTAAARGVLNGLMAELIEGHLRSHTLQPKSSKSNVDREIKEVMAVIRSYLG